MTDSGLDKSTGKAELLICWLLQDGVGTTGVSPVPPSMSDSKLRPGMPDDGVLMDMPAISFDVAAVDVRG